MGTGDRSGRWTWFLLRRALAYACWGGMDVAAMGGPLGILVGALTGWVGGSIGPADGLLAAIFTGALVGATPGMLVGDVIGTVLFLGIGLFSRPDAEKRPPKQLVASIGWGMTWTVLGSTSTALLLIGAYCGFDGVRWGGPGAVGLTGLGRGDNDLLISGVEIGFPLAMAVGASLGAMVGLRRESRRAYIGDKSDFSS